MSWWPCCPSLIEVDLESRLHQECWGRLERETWVSWVRSLWSPWTHLSHGWWSKMVPEISACHGSFVSVSILPWAKEQVKVDYKISMNDTLIMMMTFMLMMQRAGMILMKMHWMMTRMNQMEADWSTISLFSVKVKQFKVSKELWSSHCWK